MGGLLYWLFFLDRLAATYVDLDRGTSRFVGPENNKSAAIGAINFANALKKWFIAGPEVHKELLAKMKKTASP